MDWLTEITGKLGMVSDWPWLAKGVNELYSTPAIISEDTSVHVATVRYSDDAEFIAASPEMVAKLIAAVRAQEKVIRAYESECLCRLSGSRCERCQGAIETLAQLQSGEFPKEDA